MKILLLSNYNFFVGREYMHALKQAHIQFEVALFGHYSEDFDDDIRCKGLWKPETTENLLKNITYYRFENANDDEFALFLESNHYDLGIQGGTSIIKKRIIDLFKYGILNFHPGDLPRYRGCSCPEWQIFEGEKVLSTAHFITEGIDNGPIFSKKVLNLDYSSYESMRSTIYIETAQFLVDTLIDMINISDMHAHLEDQDEKIAIYWKPIPNDNLNLIITNWSKYTDGFTAENKKEL